ncbi:MAG: Mov34/MPN/PAD-1 family protein [Methylocystaceae bacterium]
MGRIRSWSINKLIANNTNPVQVSMGKAVVNEIRQLALSDTEHELGGILLGSLVNGNHKTELQVKAFIKALYTDAAQSSLTFTHKSWEQMNGERETSYPDLKVVGWFHTHPGFGVFLSSHDLFIHQNFFDLPWQIAYVVDPIRDYSGVFGWSNGQVTSLPIEVDGKLIAAVTVPEININPGGKTSIKRRPRMLVTILVLGLLVSSGFGLMLGHEKPPATYPLPYSSQEFWEHPPTMPELVQLAYEMIMDLAEKVDEAITSHSEDKTD